MTPNGHDTIQGMGPDVDVNAIKKESEEALLPIFKKHKLDWYKSRYILDNIIDLSELM